MRLLLVRHGESEHSQRGGIANSSACTGLTAGGVKQARVLANRIREAGELSDRPVLLSRPGRRAWQTAEILAEALSIPFTQQDRNLCELHPGDAEGLS